MAVIRGNFRKRPKERLLRKFRRIAAEPHWCEKCHHDIEPGEEYEGHVWVYPNHDLNIKRRT